MMKFFLGRQLKSITKLCCFGLLFLSFLCFCKSSFAEDGEILVGGVQRRFIIRIPDRLRNMPLRPAVLAIHGGGGAAEGMERTSGLTEAAEKYGFVVVYPEGTGPSPKKRRYQTWNTGVCCGEAQKQNIDEKAFFSQLIEHLVAKYKIDPQRIFATGLSNGALMSYRLACELSDKIAAIAPVAISDSYKPCHPSRPVPILHIHGTGDPCARYNGGTCGGCFQEFAASIFFLSPRKKETWPCDSVEQSLDDWRKRNHCSERKEIFFENGDALCERSLDCKDNAEVSLCRIKGAGHTWPGGRNPIKPCEKNPSGRICRLYDEAVGTTSHDLDANEIMWKFFERHPLQGIMRR